MGDYRIVGPVAGDNPGPAITALAHLHLAALASNQPLMGLTSILLRAPLVALTSLLGGGDVLAYRLGAIACLVPAGLLACWLVARRGATSGERLAGAFGAILVLASPAVVDAIHLGHPEEVLAIALATAAVLAAVRGRGTSAAVLLGLAVGTKQWALLAAPCVLLALPGQRLATAVKAGATALVLSAILPLADPAAFARQDATVGGMNFTDPFSLWWPLGSRYPVPAHAAPAIAHLLPLGLTRSAATAIAILIALSAIWLYGRRAGATSKQVDPLALLALIGLLRCVADPDPLTYNFVDLLIPLAVWEVATLRRLPVVTVLVAAAVTVLSTGQAAFLAGTALDAAPGLISGLSLAWAVTLGCYLGHRTFVPAGGVGWRFVAPGRGFRPTVEGT
jgi:hypothetical protein